MSYHLRCLWSGLVSFWCVLLAALVMVSVIGGAMFGAFLLACGAHWIMSRFVVLEAWDAAALFGPYGAAFALVVFVWAIYSEGCRVESYK